MRMFFFSFHFFKLTKKQEEEEEKKIRITKSNKEITSDQINN